LDDGKNPEFEAITSPIAAARGRRAATCRRCRADDHGGEDAALAGAARERRERPPLEAARTATGRR
jgi:hypothetical protein